MPINWESDRTVSSAIWILFSLRCKEFYATLQVPFKSIPPRKDFTDIQLCLETAREWGAEEIIMLGSLGKRLTIR